MWQRIWEYQEQDYRSAPCEIEQQVQVVRIRLNHYGDQWRVLFSNLYGRGPLVFDKVTAQVKSAELIARTPVVPLTLHGKSEIQLAPGCEQLASDPILLSAAPGEVLEITTYLAKPVQLTSFLVGYARLQQEVLNYRWVENFWTHPLDNYQLFQNALWNPRMYVIYGISGLQLQGNSQTLIAFGDSLTQQGFWTDHFKQRLVTEGFSQVALVNRGIGGNRVLLDTDATADDFSRHGRAGVKRFLSDVFADGPVSGLILFHGINDCLTIGERPVAEGLAKLTAAFRFMIEEAHLRQVPVIGVTLLPFNQSAFYSEKAESLRQGLNHWLRNKAPIEALWDFDQVAGDPQDSQKLYQLFDSGDGLHISSVGGNHLAAAVDFQQLATLLGID